MVKGKWFSQGSNILPALQVREAVFSRGRDALDDMAQQVVVYQAGSPVGAARLWWAEGAFHLGEVGVLPAQRGKGYGDLLIRLLLFKALAHHATEIQLCCTQAIAPFFTRYGFTVKEEASGEAASLCMHLAAEDVHLSGCTGTEGCTRNCAKCQETLHP